MTDEIYMRRAIELAKKGRGWTNPNPKVAGKGAQILREAGVIVEEDFLREECEKLNPVFFHYITTGNPYVVMKYAMTADGKIATKEGESRWISGEESRKKVHEMWHEYMAIMAGIGTVLADDPMLNVRTEGRKSPMRIICDSMLRIPLESQICRTAKEYRTIVAYAGEKEGGGTLNEDALRSGIVKEIKVFVAPKIFGGKGVKTPLEGLGVQKVEEAVKLKLTRVSKSGGRYFGRISGFGGKINVYRYCRRNRADPIASASRNIRENCGAGMCFQWLQEKEEYW